jgi:hypothetical protein
VTEPIPLNDPRLLPRLTQADIDRIAAAAPPELIAAPIWVCGSRAPKAMASGVVKSAKTPISPATGQNARSNDANTWGTFQQAAEHALRPEAVSNSFGIGLLGVNLRGGPWVGLDLDHVLDVETGNLLAGARALLDALPRSYVETSPSGTGLRVFFRGSLPPAFNGSVVDGAFGPGTQLEAYDGLRGARYLSVTGKVYEARGSMAVASHGELLPLVDLQQRVSGSKKKPKSAEPRSQHQPDDHDRDVARARWGLLDARLLDADLTYPAWIRVLAALRTLGSAGYEIAEQWSRRGTKYVEGDVAGRWSGLDGSSVASLFGMFDDAAPGWRDDYARNATERPAPSTQTNEADLESSGPPPDTSRRPNAVVNVDDYHVLLTLARGLLATQPDIAAQDGRLVLVTRDEHGNVLRTTPMTHGMIRERLSKLGIWLAASGENFKKVHPPETIVHALVETWHAWEGIANIASDDDIPARDWMEVAEDESQLMIVEGTVPAAGMTVVGGETNQGKSVAVVDLALRLQHGMETWLGRALIEGGASTLYLAAEGNAGLGARLRAWRAAHPSAQPAPGRYLEIRGGVPNLAAPDAVQRLHKIVREVQQRRGRAPDIVVVDTWAAARPGADENDAGAASAALHSLSVLQRVHGCALIVIHHTKKPDVMNPAPPSVNDFRGSGALVAGIDVAVILRDRAVHTVKVRDGVKPLPTPYLINSQETGRTRPDGRLETGPVVLPAPQIFAVDSEDQAEAELQRLASKLEDMETRAVEALRRLGEAPNASTVVAEMTGKREHKFAAFNRAVSKGRILRVGTSKSPRFVVADDDASSSRGREGGRESTKERPGTGNRGSPVPACLGSRGPEGTDGNLREPGTGDTPAEDDGRSSKSKGKRGSRRAKQASAAVTPERVQPDDADSEYERGEDPS